MLENKLAKEMHVSRILIREIIQKLATEGFVEISPNHPMIVTKVSIEDIK